jgi:predicted nucleic acid-binding protein
LKTWVLDAGIAAKWYLAGEPLAREAVRLSDQFQTGDVEFLVPDLFWPEFGNVLWKAVRQGRLTVAAAESAISSLATDIIPTLPSKPLLSNAFALSTAHERTVYDCIYVALAIERGCELLTADERLVNALGSRLPVRWLGGMID